MAPLPDASNASSTSKLIPDQISISKVSELEVIDVSGKKVNFGSLFSNRRIIAVFIRHFFCGNCQLYVSQLHSESERLSAALEDTNTEIIVIGCGDWQPIERYAELTGFPSDKIYTDSSREVFHALGMNIETLARTPTGEKRASYLTEGVLQNALRSTWRALMNASLIGKQGNLAQLGGEFIMGPGNQCAFAHRMRHTEDHAEISELLEKSGLQNVHIPSVEMSV